MLKLCWNSLFASPAPDTSHTDTPDTDGPDLRIGNLLDDPRLRRAMGLDVTVLDPTELDPTELDVTEPERPQPRFDRRRLLDEAAA